MPLSHDVSDLIDTSGDMLAPLLAASVITLLTALVVWKWLPRHDVQAPHAPIHIGREILRTLHSYFDPRYAGTLLIGVLMFLGYAMCQQTVGYLVQDRLLIGPEQTASIVAHAFICSAIFALTAQLLVVARLKLAPSTLLFLGLPMMLAGYVVLVQLQFNVFLILEHQLNNYMFSKEHPPL